MKDESFLDSAGPVFIISCLTLVLVFTTWVMVRGGGDWGTTTPRTAATAEVASH